MPDAFDRFQGGSRAEDGGRESGGRGLRHLSRAMIRRMETPHRKLYVCCVRGLIRGLRSGLPAHGKWLTGDCHRAAGPRNPGESRFRFTGGAGSLVERRLEIHPNAARTACSRDSSGV